MTEPARLLHDPEFPALNPTEKRLVAAALAVRKLAELHRLPLGEMFRAARKMKLLDASDEELDDMIAFASDLQIVPSRQGGR